MSDISVETAQEILMRYGVDPNGRSSARFPASTRGKIPLA